MKGMANTIILIGWVGGKHAYLNVTKEEAIRLYLEVEPEDEENLNWGGFVQEIRFENKFYVYDAWDDLM